MNIFENIKIKMLIVVAIITMSFAATALERIPVHFIVAAEHQNGTGMQASLADLDNGIAQLNNFFNELGIEFYRDEVVYITNNDVEGINNPRWSTDNEEQISPWFSYGKMNIVVADLEGVAGHAYWHYEQRDVIEIEAERLDSSTIAHEVGHNFSLKHTYQNSTDESIAVMESDNGYKYGDTVIDTPVDPGERDYFDDCHWLEGSAFDIEGVEYAPDGYNVMGKGQHTCRNRFSDEQKQRMVRIIQTYKFHLFDKYGSNQNPSCANSAKVTHFPSDESFDYEKTVNNLPWVQDVFNDNDFNWKIDVKTSSSSTGASSSQAGHNFIHIDSGHEFLSAGYQVNLLSPCYDLSNQNMAEIEFYYHMYGVDIGKLSLEVTTDNGASWFELWNKEHQQHNAGETWSRATVSLASYLNKSIQLKLKGQVIGGSKGDISLDTITLRTSPVGEKPVITGQQALSTNEDQSLTLTVADLTYANEGNVDDLIIAPGENYQMNEKTITPDRNFNGRLFVAVSAINDGTQSAPYITTIDVIPVNDEPTAVDDNIVVLQDSMDNIIDVLGNDTDVDQDILTLSQVNYDGSGNFTLSDNKIMFTPPNGIIGTENLTYIVNDSKGGTATGKLIITITAATFENSGNSANPKQSSGGSLYSLVIFLFLLLINSLKPFFTSAITDTRLQKSE